MKTRKAHWTRMFALLAAMLLSVPASAAPPEAAPPPGEALRTVARAPEKKPLIPSRWWQKPLPKPETGELPFAEGEHLHYKIRVLGKEAAWGEARVGKAGRRGDKRVQRLTGRVRTLGVFEGIYPVQDDLSSLLDMTTATPVEAAFTMAENRRPKRDVTLSFMGVGPARAKGRSIRGKAHRRIDDRAPLRILDPLSTFYHLRARELAVGDRFPLFVHNGRRIYRLDAHVVRQEKVFTDVGERTAWRIEGRAVRADGSRKSWSQDMTFWLSADSLRLPLKVAFDMKIGRVEAVLDGYKGLSAPRKQLASQP